MNWGTERKIPEPLDAAGQRLEPGDRVGSGLWDRDLRRRVQSITWFEPFGVWLVVVENGGRWNSRVLLRAEGTEGKTRYRKEIKP